MTSSTNHSQISPAVKAAVLVAALGYFVDAFDLLLFSILRVESLQAIGLSGDELLHTGKSLLNIQMWGMLIGGLFWGILGDKVGRIQILFGSIFLYSVATFLNAYVENTTQYFILRFLAGMGLAGELGGGITLVSELLPKDRRGIGTTIVATIGVTGVIAAGILGKVLPWRTTYMVGGVLGFALLLMRIGVHESGMFNALKQEESVRRGDFSLIFRSKDRFVRYIACIAVATPTWFVVGILMTFCAEIGTAKGLVGTLSAADALLWCYVGLTAGDLASGLYSQKLKSRKQAIFYFLLIEALSISALFLTPIKETWHYYAFCLPLGFGVGYWAVFVTSSAEQFGTNLRATVATTVPNFVRASVIPMTSGFVALKGAGFGVLESSMFVGFVTMAVAFTGAIYLRESFSTDLDFVEKH